jgi:hypothetical protein
MRLKCLQKLRKALFGGLTDAELEEEHASWRQQVHNVRGILHRSAGEAWVQRKKSDKMFQVAEETAKIFEKGIKELKDIRSDGQSRQDSGKRAETK